MRKPPQGPPSAEFSRARARKATTDALASLSIDRLRRSGIFKRGTVVPIMLIESGGEVAMLKARVQANELRLETVRPEAPPATRSSVQSVRLAFSDSTFGRRAYMVCPSCGSSRGVLYRDQRGYRCRRCLGLAFRSERQGRLARALAKAKRLHVELGGSGDLAVPILDPPRGMRLVRFARLQAKLEGASAKVAEIQHERAQRVAQRRSRKCAAALSSVQGNLEHAED